MDRDGSAKRWPCVVPRASGTEALQGLKTENPVRVAEAQRVDQQEGPDHDEHDGPSPPATSRSRNWRHVPEWQRAQLREIHIDRGGVSRERCVKIGSQRQLRQLLIADAELRRRSEVISHGGKATRRKSIPNARLRVTMMLAGGQGRSIEACSDMRWASRSGAVAAAAILMTLLGACGGPTTRVTGHHPSTSTTSALHPVSTSTTTAASTTSTAPSPALGGANADCQGCGQVAPATLTLGGYSLNGAVFGGMKFSQVAWQSWGSAQATAPGTNANFVSPGESGTVTLIAFDLGQCGSTYGYQALEWLTGSQSFDPSSYYDTCDGKGVGQGFPS